MTTDGEKLVSWRCHASDEFPRPICWILYSSRAHSIQRKLFAAVPDGIREIASGLRQREKAIEAFITRQDIWIYLLEIAIQCVSVDRY